MSVDVCGRVGGMCACVNTYMLVGRCVVCMFLCECDCGWSRVCVSRYVGMYVRVCLYVRVWGCMCVYV